MLLDVRSSCVLGCTIHENLEPGDCEVLEKVLGGLAWVLRWRASLQQHKVQRAVLEFAVQDRHHVQGNTDWDRHRRTAESWGLPGASSRTSMLYQLSGRLLRAVGTGNVNDSTG